MSSSSCESNILFSAASVKQWHSNNKTHCKLACFSSCFPLQCSLMAFFFSWIFFRQIKCSSRDCLHESYSPQACKCRKHREKNKLIRTFSQAMKSSKWLGAGELITRFISHNFGSHIMLVGWSWLANKKVCISPLAHNHKVEHTAYVEVTLVK